MNTLDQPAGLPGIFALFKGPSGAGKSVGALSFPGLWVADLDRKMPAIALKHFPKKSIDYDQFKDIFDLADKIQGWLAGNNCPYETLLYDSLTSLAGLTISSIGEVKGESTPQMLKTMKATRAGGQMVELLGYDYYNGETRYIDWFLTANKILFSRPGNPKNIIFNAHIITTESAPDIRTKLVTRTRSIVTVGRKAAAIIPTPFDELYVFGTFASGGTSATDPVKIHHAMTTESIGEDDAKTAFKLTHLVDFTDSNLYDLLQKQIAGQQFMASVSK